MLFAGLMILNEGCKSRSSPPETQTFRVMTYNLHHGEGLDKRIDLLRIAEVIKREGADIVALQEVDKGVERTARRDLPGELAELTGMSCVFSNNYAFQGGEYGNAVLTRFPVIRFANTHYKMAREGEQRGLLQVVLQVHGREIAFLNTHVDYRPDDSERLMNAAEIKVVAGQYGSRPIILCGDFNDVPGSRLYAKLDEIFDDAWQSIGKGAGLTFSADQPRKRIDYIWISKGLQIVPRRIWVAESEGSDHLPLVAELGWR